MVMWYSDFSDVTCAPLTPVNSQIDVGNFIWNLTHIMIILHDTYIFIYIYIYIYVHPTAPV